MTTDAQGTHAGWQELLGGSLFETIWRRRTHRVSRGVKVIDAGSMTYRSDQTTHPLDEIEEAVLIAATGCSGLTMPDRPFQDPTTNEFIQLTKSSSLLSVIGVYELTRSGQTIIARTFAAFEIYLGIAVFYLLLIGVLSGASAYLERRVLRLA